MIRAHIAGHAALLHVGPLALDGHDVHLITLVHRAHEAGIGARLLADGEIHIRRGAINRLEGLRLTERLRNLDALMRGRQAAHARGEHIALHALLDDPVPLLAQFQNVDGFPGLKRLHAQRRAALLAAHGEFLVRHSQILRVRRVVIALRGGQIDDVLGKNVALHAILVDEGPLASVFHDTDQLICLNTPQLSGGG